ncbi:unnamed protein product [Rhodiola kirilowii]
MGCVGSKPEESQAVKLCRERCTFLDEAVKQRYAFAQAHLLYMQSLKQIGVSLRDYFDQDLDDDESYVAPVLPLPKAKKGDLKKGLESTTSSPDDLPHHVHSNSGSHLNFNTDSDEDGDDDGEGSSGSVHHTHRRHHSGNFSGSPLQPQRGYTMMNEDETLGYGGGFNGVGGGFNGGGGGFNGVGGGFNGGGGGYMHMNYMRKQPTPSVSYQQKPMSPEVANMGQSSYFPYNYFSSNDQDNSAPSSSSYQQFNGYSSYGGGRGPYGGGQNGGYYGPQGGYGGGGGGGSGSGMAEASGSTSKPPPPPPSPPRGSTWDFMNVFENNYNDRFYAASTPSRDSVDVREAEGIPDLEEDYQHEVVKEVHGRQKFVGAGVGPSMGGGNVNYPKSAVANEERKKNDREDMYQARPSVAENEGMEYEVHVVDKKVVDSEKSEGVRTRGGGLPMGVSEAVKAIQAQFDRASEAANELASMLEVGKRQYRKKHGGYHGKVSSKMLHAIKPSLSLQPSTSNAAEIGSSALTDISEATGQSSKSLAATLQKLHIWEKKLYAEVKAEEKLREDHDKKRQKLKHLDEKGAEHHKVEATRTLIRNLSTKIRIGIQIVDKISVTINNIRDDELWPQLNDLIHGLTRMWKCMLDCHHNQLLAIREARNLDTIAAHKKPSHSNLEMMNQLVHELCNWTSGFSSWVSAQRKFIKSLNFWLLKCLLYEPEETPDGPAPFSPGRIGAPSIFVICHQWSQAFDRISEKEVISSMRGLTLCVRQFWEQDKSMLRQSMDATKALESKVRELDREDQKMQKEMQTLDKKLVVSVPGAAGLVSLADQAVYQSDTSNASLKMSLQLVFDSMEKFTAISMKEYEELLQRIDEDKLAKQSARES